MSRIYNTSSIEKEYCVMGIYSALFAWGWTSQAWDPSLYERGVSALHTMITSYNCWVPNNIITNISNSK